MKLFYLPGLGAPYDWNTIDTFETAVLSIVLRYSLKP
jgi:hypothetical protein